MNTISVPRDLGDRPILVSLEDKAKVTIFFRHNGNISRLGPPIKDTSQVRAILFKKYKTELDMSLIYPVKDREIDRPNRLHAVNRRFLAAIDAARFETLERCGVRYLRKGWIRVNRWEKKQGKILFTPLHVPDIDATIRMEDHVLEKYRGGSGEAGEFADLVTYDSVIREANNILTSLKNYGASLKMAIEKLVRVILRLELCWNEEKTAIHDQLQKVATGEDSRGRVNPGAFAARTVAALNSLARRFQELRIIEPRIALRHELLIFEKRSFEMQEKQIGLMIRNLARQIFGRPDLAGRMENRFGRILYFTGFLWPSPFYERAKLVDGYLLDGKKEARQNRPERAINRLVVAHHLLNGGSPPKNP